jgi:site-specific recombinase XerD
VEAEYEKTIEDFESYLLLEKKYSKNTIVSYQNDLSKFKEFYKRKKVIKIT